MWMTLKDLTNPRCLELALAKSLNVAIGLGSVVVKVPQIYKIVASRSVEGLSPVSFYLDTVVSTANTVYHYLLKYDFETYADSAFTTVQNLILVLLLWAYEKKQNTDKTDLSARMNKFFTVVCGVLLTMAFLSIPKSINDVEFFRDNLHPDIKILIRLPYTNDLRKILQLIILPLLVVSRGSQIMQNFINRSTGSLSLITNVLQLLGASARIFTVISGNGGDGALITSNVIAAALSGIIVFQIVSFSDSQTTTRKKKD